MEPVRVIVGGVRGGTGGRSGLVVPSVPVARQSRVVLDVQPERTVNSAVLPRVVRKERVRAVVGVGVLLPVARVFRVELPVTY